MAQSYVARKKKDNKLEAQFNFLNTFLGIDNVDEARQLAIHLERYNNKADDYDIIDFQDFIGYYSGKFPYLSNLALIDAMDAAIKTSEEVGLIKDRV